MAQTARQESGIRIEEENLVSFKLFKGQVAGTAKTDILRTRQQDDSRRKTSL